MGKDMCRTGMGIYPHCVTVIINLNTIFILYVNIKIIKFDEYKNIGTKTYNLKTPIYSRIEWKISIKMVRFID